MPGWDQDLEGDPWVLGIKGSPRARRWGRTQVFPPPAPWHPMGGGQHRVPLGSPPSHPRKAQDQPQVSGLALAFSAPRLSPALVARRVHPQAHTRTHARTQNDFHASTAPIGCGWSWREECERSDSRIISLQLGAALETSGDFSVGD